MPFRAGAGQYTPCMRPIRAWTVHRMASAGAIVSLLAAVASLQVGCATKRTVPPTDGKSVMDTSFEPLPTLCVLAIEKGHEIGYGAADPGSAHSIIYNLPATVRRETWVSIGRRLPASATPMRPGDANVISVEEIRIDGGNAQVDVLVPRGNLYQLYTMHLTGGVFSKWKVTYAQPWTLRTEPPTTNNPWAGDARSNSAPTEAVTAGSDPAVSSN